MLEKFFAVRREEIKNAVWQISPVDILERTDDVAAELVKSHMVKPLGLAPNDDVTVDELTDGVIMRFGIPFGGDAAAMTDVLLESAPEIPLALGANLDPGMDHARVIPASNTLLLSFYGKYTDDAQAFFGRMYSKKSRIGHVLDRAHNHIQRFNDGVPGLVREAVADRAGKLRLADELRAGLAGPRVH